ncbi:3'(2'),5'-bisphosphate nucleotidase CysQ [Celerinatantimonas yamalensis]|uniref:3'(2'),5'-bisphosphate nucleotidase CysQ n=1 Tax=Celerinatantimonas yamalensis TaxID=559956 RepID=A0ABW9G7Q7_9GAMM
MPQSLTDLLPAVEQIARQAGQAILALYQSGDYQAQQKADHTPVTSADLAAHQLLCDAFGKLTPEWPVLSEEHDSLALAERAKWDYYWLVDPMDGTQEFVSRSGDFSTMIALICHGEPVLGLVYAPVTNTCYYAMKGLGAYKIQGQQGPQQIHCRHYPQIPETLRIAVSRVQNKRKLDKVLNEQYRYEFLPLGSASLKSCLVAEGAADCYIRLGPTGEWDVGAPLIILKEAGGTLLDLHLQPMSFNCHESLINPDFIGIGDDSLPWADIIAHIPNNDRLRTDQLTSNSSN